MKILFFTNHKYLPEIFAGMEINTDLLCNEILKSHQNVEVAVACSMYGGKSLLGITSKIKRVIKATKITTDIYHGYKCFRAFDIYRYIDEVISIYRPDAIVVQGGHKYYEILTSLSNYSIPVISYLHTSDSLQITDGLSLPENITYIANSKFTASNHKDKLISFIMPPLIIPEQYKVASRREFITLINPIPHKGVEVAVQLAKKNTDKKFLFVIANKNGVDALKAYINSAGELKNILIEGPFKDMRQVYKKTKLILMPSKQESWGRVATEAHCSGIPVLASDVEGLPESVGHGGINLPISSELSTWQQSLDHMLSAENYDLLVQNTRQFSQRDEINPQFLVNKFIEHIQLQIDRAKK